MDGLDWMDPTQNSSPARAPSGAKNVSLKTKIIESGLMGDH